MDLSNAFVGYNSRPVVAFLSAEGGQGSLLIALDWLLFCIQHADPKYGPVYMNKINISDGFYRVWLAANSALKLAVVLPSCPGEEPLVAIPLTLSMGWIKSPPAF
jgi:hypothetical protein